MVVTVEEMEKINDRIKEINNCPLEEINITKNGETIKIDKQEIEDFTFTGLSNRDFISNFY